MIVTALLVCHDGERWLPAVLDALAAQTRPVDRLIALDAGSVDATPTLLGRELAGPDRVASWPAHVLALPRDTSYPEAVRLGLEGSRALVDSEPEGSALPEETEWIWLLHDDCAPAPDALAALVAAASEHPEAAVLGPKIREWPSLRRLVEIGVTISGTGRRETGLERGEYDQGQHDGVREVLAVNTAGMLVRRDVLDELGGFDEHLPIFGNDVDFGWRAARVGHTTLVVPAAVLFHAEAARRGVRRTALTGPHPLRAERVGALHTLLANVPARRLAWQTVRLFFGTWLRVLGHLVARAPQDARDEVAALWDVYRRPGVIRRARAERAAALPADPARAQAAQARTQSLLAPWWVPYRHGLDFLVDLSQAVTRGAQDVAERRRDTRAEAVALPSPRHSHFVQDDDDVYADSGWAARFFTNPVALLLGVALVLMLISSREALGHLAGGALSPAPQALGDWWRLHVESRHALGTGSSVPAPGYVAPLALLGLFTGGPQGALSALMIGAVPVAVWGAWRLLRVIGHVADPHGLPRWALLWGSLSYGLVPALSGAWGQGRFGVVAAAALLPWLTHAALAFADPDPRRRWRAAWRTGVLLSLTAAFVPMVWPVAIALVVVLLLLARLISRDLLSDRSTWLPPLTALLMVPVLLAPWLVPMLFSGARSGLLLEAGRLPVSDLSTWGLLTGRLVGADGATGGTGPAWLGLLLLALAVLALVPRSSRLVVLGCWVVASATSGVVAALSWIRLDLGILTSTPGTGLFVVLLSGTFVVAVTVALGAVAREAAGRHLAGRGLVLVVAAVVAAVPVVGLGWWLKGPETVVTSASESVVPAYMAQRSAQDAQYGVLILSGSVAEGLTYRIRRDDGITVGEDEVLALTPEDTRFTRVVGDLTARPDPDLVAELGQYGIEYVLMTAPVDGQVAATLDATDGLQSASAEDRTTRAWQVDQPLGTRGLDGGTTWWRWLLVGLQLLAVLVAMVLCGPDLRTEREERTDDD